MLFADTSVDWPAIIEKGVTSAMMAVAFGYALWKIGMKLLDSHFDLVAKANTKMDSMAESTKSIDHKMTENNNKLDQVIEKVSDIPSDFTKLCRATCPVGMTEEDFARYKEIVRQQIKQRPPKQAG